MSKEKQIEFERNEISEIIANNFRLNDEKYDASDFEWSAHCLQMAGFHKQSDWISVDERLPDPWNDYLVVVKLKYAWETEWEYHVDMATFVNDGGYIDDVWTTFNDWNEGQECHITHWMPLPEAPKMKGGAE